MAISATASGKQIHTGRGRSARERFTQYLARVGIEFDVAVNVLTGGQLGQTVSLRIADEQRVEKKRGVFGWGCILCRFLDVAVQEDHCELQFTTDPSPWTVYVRSGIAFAVGILSAWLMGREALHLIAYGLHLL